MSHHLLATAQSEAGSTAYLLVRLTLSAGFSTDELAHDLRTNFAEPKKASELCGSTNSLRGLPSRGEAFTAAEEKLLPAVPRRVQALQDVIAVAGEIEATSVNLYDGIQWHRVNAEGEKEPLSELELFRLRPAS